MHPLAVGVNGHGPVEDTGMGFTMLRSSVRAESIDVFRKVLHSIFYAFSIPSGKKFDEKLKKDFLIIFFIVFIFIKNAHVIQHAGWLK